MLPHLQRVEIPGIDIQEQVTQMRNQKLQRRATAQSISLSDLLLNANAQSQSAESDSPTYVLVPDMPLFRATSNSLVQREVAFVKLRRPIVYAKRSRITKLFIHRSIISKVLLCPRRRHVPTCRGIR